MSFFEDFTRRKVFKLGAEAIESAQRGD